MIYLFNRNKSLIGTVLSDHVIEAIFERELNGLYFLSVDLPITHTDKDGTVNYYDKVTEATYIGHYDLDGRFQLHRIVVVDVEDSQLHIQGIHLFFDEAKAFGIIKEQKFIDREVSTVVPYLFQPLGWELYDYDTTTSESISLYEISLLEARKKLIELYNVEFNYWLEFNGTRITAKRYEVRTKIGKDTKKRYHYGSNVLKIKVEEDYNDIYTAVIGRGMDLATIEKRIAEEKKEAERKRISDLRDKITAENKAARAAYDAARKKEIAAYESAVKAWRARREYLLGLRKKGVKVTIPLKPKYPKAKPKPVAKKLPEYPKEPKEDKITPIPTEQSREDYVRRVEFTNVVWTKPTNPLDKPAGQRMLVDPVATEAFGYMENGEPVPKVAVVEFTEIEDPKLLLEESYKWLMQNNLPKAVFSVEIDDASELNLGDGVYVIYEEIDRVVPTRAAKIKDNLLSKLREAEFGDVEFFKEDTKVRQLQDELKRSSKRSNAFIKEQKDAFNAMFAQMEAERREAFEQALAEAYIEVDAFAAEMDITIDSATEDFIEDIESTIENITLETQQKQLEYEEYLKGELAAADQRTQDAINAVAGMNGGGSSNILDTSALVQSNLSNVNNMYDYDGSYQFTTSTPGGGLLVKASKLEPNTKYALAFDYEVVSGALSTFGGETQPTWVGIEKIVVDGETRTTALKDPYSMYAGNTGSKHTVEIYLTTPATINPEDLLFIQPNKGLSDPVTVKISDLTLSRGDKPMLDWYPSNASQLKRTELILNDQGFLLGNRQVGGNTFATAIVGHADSLALIGDNVDVSNNLTVQGTVKTWALEAAMANIGILKSNMITAGSVTTDLLAAEAVTANKLKVDRAFIDKLMTNSIFTDALYAKNVEATRINAGEIRSILLTSDVILAKHIKADAALFDKVFVSDAVISRLTAKTAFIRDIQAIDINLNRATVTGAVAGNYITIVNDELTQYGTFTRTWRGKTRTYNIFTRMKEGHIRFRNNDLNRSLYLSEFGISTMLDGVGEYIGEEGASGTIQFWDTYYSPSDAKGVTVNSHGGVVALRSDLNKVVLDADQTVNLDSDQASIYMRPMKKTRAGNNEFRFWVKDNSLARDTDGVISYGSLSSSYGSGIRLDKSADTTYVYATNNNGDIGTGTFYGNIKYPSLVEYKDDINIWEYDALTAIKDEVKLYSYRYKTNPNEIVHGFVIGEGYDILPEFHNDGGINSYEVVAWNTRAIQQLGEITDELKSENQSLRKELDEIKTILNEMRTN